jgi:DNA-binding NtrC family response regulator
METTVILIFKKDEKSCRDLKRHLIQNGLKVIHTQIQSTSLQLFRTLHSAIVIVHAPLKDAKKELKIIKQIRRQNKKTPIILIAKKSSEAMAIAALKAGVNDFFKEPFECEKLRSSIHKHLSGHLENSVSKCEQPIWQTQSDLQMIGDSRPMLEVKTNLLKIAKTDCTVLITGETGTGKELATRAIHYNSKRDKKPLVCVNCAAIPGNLVESELFGYEKGAFTGAIARKKGLFEEADGGTIFLDEIGDMAPYTQAKILRTIEMKETFRLGGKSKKIFDFRVIAATNKNPDALVAEKKFRKDLYYRLNVARVHLPPLRDRKEDILPLVDYYVDQFNSQFSRRVISFTKTAINALLCYHWPGNVRELKNLIEVSFINLPTKKVEFIDLPEKLRSSIKTIKSLPENERDRVISALHANRWNKSKAAQKLNWSRMTLYRKIAKYNITKKPKS